jgi:hypothetical protein
MSLVAYFLRFLGEVTQIAEYLYQIFYSNDPSVKNTKHFWHGLC